MKKTQVSCFSVRGAADDFSFILLKKSLFLLFLILIGSLNAQNNKLHLSKNLSSQGFLNSFLEVLPSNNTLSKSNVSKFEYLKNSKQEDLSKRDLFTKHFMNGDGSYTAVIGSGPVHYHKNGKWEDIDTNILSGGESSYMFYNTSNLMESYFGTYSQNGIVSKTNEGEIKEFLETQMYWEINGEKTNIIKSSNVQPVVKGNKVNYEKLFGNIDAEYSVWAGKRKLNYVIPNIEALGTIPSGAEYLVFSEKIQIPAGWSYQQVKEGVVIKNSYGNSVYTYNHPTSNDINDLGLFNNNTFFAISKYDDTLILNTKVDVKWLRSADRKYPVYVDPTSTYTPENVDYATAQMNSAGGGTSGVPAAGKAVGAASSATWYRGFIKFSLASIPASTVSDVKIALTTGNVLNIDSSYMIGITQSNYDLPYWASTYTEMYNYVTNTSNTAGDYYAVSSPGSVGTTNTYTLPNQAKTDVAVKTGSSDSFFCVTLRQGWSAGNALGHYVVYYDHTGGDLAPKLIVTYMAKNNYCVPAHIYANCAALGDCQYIGISNVTLNTLNSSTGINNIPLGYNELSETTTLKKGNSYNLTVTYKDNGSTPNTGYVAAWADWNQDGTFNDTDEYLGTSGIVTTNQQTTFAVNVPSSIVSGSVRFRVRSVYNDELLSGTDACTTKDYGETEDYIVTVEETLGSQDVELTQLSVYPNPTSGIINIRTKYDIKDISVYSLSGQKLQTTLKGKTLDFRNAPSGVYMLKIVLANNKEINQKVVKE